MNKIILILALLTLTISYSQVDPPPAEEDRWSDFDDDTDDEYDPATQDDVADEETKQALYDLADNENTSGYDMSPEAIDHLLENGVSPYLVEQYINGDTTEAVDDVIEQQLYEYEREVADQLFSEITEGQEVSEDYQYDLSQHLDPEEMEEAASAMDEFMDTLEAPNMELKNMDATYVKERFLAFIQAHKEFILRHAEYIVVFNLILDLINDDINIEEIMRIAGLPDTSILGNPLERVYDRHMTQYLENYRNAIPLDVLERLGTSFENSVLENFSPATSETILNEY